MASAPREVRSLGRRLRPGALHRALACAVAMSFATAPWTVQAAVVQDSEIERLYVEGQDKYAEGDFAGAADAWTRLLDRLPEAQANRATRENVLLNVLQAHLDAYARTRRDDGSKDIEHLRQAKTVLEGYFASFKQAYGDRAAVSAAVQEKADELERTLEEAEKEAAAAAQASSAVEPETPTETTPTEPSKSQPNIIVLESESDGGGLIAGGAIAAGFGLGGLGMLVAGVVLAGRATEDYEVAHAAGDQDGLDEATKLGNTGNALTITGAIVGPVLLATGGVLIGLGLKRRKDAKAARDAQLRSISVVPTGNRTFGGVVLSGRF